MKRAHFPYSVDRSWLLLPVLIISIISLTFLLTLTSTSSESNFSFHHPKFTFSERDFDNLPKLPRFDYLISGTKGDGPHVKRLLQAVYHPRNYYLLHLDLEASDSERVDLARKGIEGMVVEIVGDQREAWQGNFWCTRQVGNARKPR
ncbi:hypothetical protein V6N11_031879 [Hibiscus sabdariffa]|uniref:Uncharacterized protein n=1 Tax=Hibiscus sabdariffa TaxID=183260 RepID=A0ABR2SZA1_9ROSI